MKRVAIFLCDDRTRSDCFKYNLLGTNEPYGLAVHRGDYCLLYDYDHNIVYGTWQATENGGNHNRAAWNGDFVNQVPIAEAGARIVEKPRNLIQRVIGGRRIIGRIYEGSTAQELFELFHVEPRPPRRQEQYLRNTSQEDTRPEPTFFCDDGDRVRTQGEKIIDDTLHRFGVRHTYEPQLPGVLMVPDFVVYSRSNKPVYIEYWGLLNDSRYQQRRQEKLRLYRHNNLNLIEIFPEDIKVIDFVLAKSLKRHGIPVRLGLFGFIAQAMIRLLRLFGGKQPEH